MEWEEQFAILVIESLVFFSINMGHGWAYEAEVKAILKALVFCQQFAFQNVVLESDSTTVIAWVKAKRNRPWKLLNDLNQMDFLMSEVNCLGIHHIFREANGMTDHLAKFMCNRRNNLWWASAAR